MFSRIASFFCLALLLPLPLAVAQTSPQRDAQAVALTGQAVLVLTGGTNVQDVVLQATANYIAGSDQESGTATFKGRGNAESRSTLSLSGGQRREIRNHQAGAWSGPDAIWHALSLHNTWAGATWFFPVLDLQAALSDPSVAVIYVGLETRGGVSVQHLRFYRDVSGQSQQVTALISRLSTLEVFLDSVSFSPVAFDFNAHADNDAGLDIPVEIRFSGYRSMSGVQVPTRVQKLLNNSLFLDLNVTSGAVNTGLTDSEFALP